MRAVPLGAHVKVCFWLQISQLVEDVQRLQTSIAKLQETSAGQIARLEEQLEHKRQHIARLEARLDAQRDYDDVKRELRSAHNKSRMPSQFWPNVTPNYVHGYKHESLKRRFHSFLNLRKSYKKSGQV
jgi:homeobox protein cut-like